MLQACNMHGLKRCSFDHYSSFLRGSFDHYCFAYEYIVTNYKNNLNQISEVSSFWHVSIICASNNLISYYSSSYMRMLMHVFQYSNFDRSVIIYIYKPIIHNLDEFKHLIIFPVIYFFYLFYPACNLPLQNLSRPPSNFLTALPAYQCSIHYKNLNLTSEAFNKMKKR